MYTLSTHASSSLRILHGLGVLQACQLCTLCWVGALMLARRLLNVSGNYTGAAKHSTTHGAF